MGLNPSRASIFFVYVSLYHDASGSLGFRVAGLQIADVCAYVVRRYLDTGAKPGSHEERHFQKLLSRSSIRSHMVENTSFISSILAAPSDDAPRLIYADWLEEQGDGTRAEFIRLQCELAQIEVGFKANADAKVSTHELIHMANTLRRREQELFNPNWFQMDGVPGKADFDRHWNRFIYTVQHPQQKGACLLLAPIKRGFIAEAHTTLKVWMGTECPNCYVRPNENDEPRSCCALCLDTGRLPGYGRDVVTVQPIEAVYLTDKQPLRLLNNNGECHRWFISKRILNENDNHVLPQQLFSFLLPGGIPARPLGPPWFWETEQDAQNALATALIAWAKSSPQRLTPA